jgi:hypothetical protein
MMTKDDYLTTCWKLRKRQMINDSFERGDIVSKVGGDYSFDGVVIGVFSKLSGKVRYAVEDDRGVVHIYSRHNLKLREVTSFLENNERMDIIGTNGNDGLGYYANPD